MVLWLQGAHQDRSISVSSLQSGPVVVLPVVEPEPWQNQGNQCDGRYSNKSLVAGLVRGRIVETRRSVEGALEKSDPTTTHRCTLWLATQLVMTRALEADRASTDPAACTVPSECLNIESYASSRVIRRERPKGISRGGGLDGVRHRHMRASLPSTIGLTRIGIEDRQRG